MNNSKIAIDSFTLREEPEVDTLPMLREQATELAEIIEALDNVTSSNYWKLLQNKVWGGILSNLQSRMNKEKDPTEIYRYQGQIIWAEKYTDIEKLTDVYRKKLVNLKNKI